MLFSTINNYVEIHIDFFFSKCRLDTHQTMRPFKIKIIGLLQNGRKGRKKLCGQNFYKFFLNDHMIFLF